MDNQEYLQPGFDPNSLKVPELRGILLEHSVDYPSSAKKAQLVELFIQHVVPKARRIINARSRVVATTQGILDVDRDETPPFEQTPRRRSSRRSTRLGTTETEDTSGAEETTRRSPRKRSVSAKRASSKPARTGEIDATDVDDQQLPRSTRKTRNSASRQSLQPVVPDMDSRIPIPQLKRSPSDEENEASVFSSQNPFQSGSSPFARSPDRSDRRKVRSTFVIL